MVKCTKGQCIVRKNADGTSCKRTRCVNNIANTYRQSVTDDICNYCSLRQMWDCHCILTSPIKPIYTQPQLGLSGEVIYIDGEPPCPYGYTPTTNPLIFTPDWPSCAYMEFANELNSDGSLKTKARCTVTNKLTDPQTCKSCLGDVELISPKEYPPIATELVTYANAVKGWVAAGRPVRSEEEVAAIHSQYCSQCDWYDAEQQRCKGCGCKTRAEGAALLNKIKMGTQHCPKQLW